MDPFVVEDLGNGLKLIHPRSAIDDRGAFTVTYTDEVRPHGHDWVQENEVLTYERATIRGLHSQMAPWAQAKLIRVLHGAILDVVVDINTLEITKIPLRPGPWLYIPDNFAHGYLTQEDYTHLQYKVSSPYRPDAEFGLRWDDPTLGIDWGIDHPRLSKRDREWDLLTRPAQNSARLSFEAAL